jgi:vacuolar protein sorting-associated protein 53
MLQQVGEIKRKAAQSEAMVQEICRDIKKLDFAKKHLTSTITALRRLGMLITAVDQLQLAAERREFGEAAHLLGAVQQLAAHFKEYSHVPRVAEMRGRVAALEQSLRGTSLREFELLGEDFSSPALLDRLRDCCAVTAAVGPAARDELVDSVCRREMGVYTQIFSTIGETAKLERTMNRYKWLLRRLEARKDVWGIFPADWRVPQLLCVTFCSITKTQLAEILDEKAGELPHQISNLLKAVEATHIFEAEMSRRYESPGGSGINTSSNNNYSGQDGDGDGFDAGEGFDAAEVRWRYEKERAQRNTAVTATGSPTKQALRQHAAAEAVARALFRGSISQVFVPYLKVYVDHVERSLTWNVDQITAAESWQALAADQQILKSANELTEAVRGEMKDCVSRISRGQTLLDLSRVFGKVYTAYASRLISKLPSKSGVGGGSGGSGSGYASNLSTAAVLGVTDWHIKLAEGDVQVIALIINTAEHCIEMLRQLEKALVARLEAPLGEKVDFSEQEDEFRSVVTQCLTTLILGVETKLEIHLASLMRHNWAAVEIAGDQSDFVGAMRAVLADVGTNAGPALPSNHFRYFCDKLLRSLAPRVRESIFRCRVISDAGCQQLRLDMEALKGGLVSMAKAGHADEDSASWTATFAADVNAQLASVEAVLKVVSSPSEALLDAFMELLPDASPSEFQRIADLKGLKRSELAAVLDDYTRRVGHVLPRGALMNPHDTTAALGGGSSNYFSSSGSGGGTDINGGVFTSPLRGTTGMPSSFRAPATRVASKASTSAQEMAARLNSVKQNANLQAAKATDSMRETTGRMLGAMKSLRFMQRDQQQQQNE